MCEKGEPGPEPNNAGSSLTNEVVRFIHGIDGQNERLVMRTRLDSVLDPTRSG